MSDTLHMRHEMARVDDVRRTRVREQEFTRDRGACERMAAIDAAKARAARAAEAYDAIMRQWDTYKRVPKWLQEEASRAAKSLNAALDVCESMRGQA